MILTSVSKLKFELVIYDNICILFHLAALLLSTTLIFDIVIVHTYEMKCRWSCIRNWNNYKIYITFDDLKSIKNHLSFYNVKKYFDSLILSFQNYLIIIIQMICSVSNKELILLDQSYFLLPRINNFLNNSNIFTWTINTKIRHGRRLIKNS